MWSAGWLDHAVSLEGVATFSGLGLREASLAMGLSER